MKDKTILKKAIEKYAINSNGIVTNRKTDRRLKTYYDGKRYPYISVYMGEGKSKKINIHRLVAHLYIPNPENLPQVNHKDGDHTNNTVTNLEWCTVSYNVSDGFKRGRVIWNKGNASKKRIFYYCKKYPRQIFWILTNNDFYFAKAFWGEKDFYHLEGQSTIDGQDWNDEIKIAIPIWQYHLQQMVLEKDPIKYLEQFL